MGLTCASIHVFTGALNVAAPAEIDRLIHAASQRLGYEPVEQPAAGERQLAALPGPSWFSVQEQESPLVTESLIDLAREISAISAGSTLITSVYDSDAFAFLLFERGKQVDGYASSDELVPIKFKKWSATRRPQEWSRAFGKILTPADFQQVMKPVCPFADQQLLRLCQLLEISAEKATMTWKDLDHAAPACRRFALRSRAGAGSRMAVTQFVPSGLEAARVAEYTGKMVKALPLLVRECRHLSFVLSGPAEAFVDSVLEISGPAIEQNLVELESEAEWATDEAQGRRILRGRLQGILLGGGPSAPGQQTKLALGLLVRGLSVGVGEFQVRFRPNGQGAEQLSLFPVCRVEVTVPQWIPRGCKQGTTILVDHGLRILNTPRIMSAVAIVEDRGDEAFAALRSLGESWLGDVAANSDATVRVNYAGLLDDQGRNKKSKAQLSLADVRSSKKWQKFFQEPAALQSLFLQLLDDTGQAEAGVNVQRPNTYTGTRETVHLGFWRTRRAGEVEVETRARLVALVDRIFAALPALQGWLVQWDWLPLFTTADDNNYSPYEDAYGLNRTYEGPLDNGGGFMSRNWCRRTLRGLGSPLWLGADLLASVSRTELEKTAQVTEIGPSAIRLEGAAQDLEEILLPILPRAAQGV